MDRLSQKILLLNGWRRALLAVVAGAATALAFAPFHLFFVGFVTFPILVWLLDGAVGEARHGAIRRLMPAFAVGWCFGFGLFVASLWWIANALLVEAPEFAWAIPLAVIGLPAFLAFFYAFAAALARAIWTEGLARIFVFAAAFGFAEWLRSFLLTGFPWNAIAYAIMPTPIMMQTVAFAGYDAMSIIAVALFAMPAAIFANREAKTFATLLLLLGIGGHLATGYWRLHLAPEPQEEGRIVRIVQPSVDQSMKWQPEMTAKNFNDLLALSAAENSGAESTQPDIIVWPETSVPFILTREPTAIAAIADMLKIGQVLVAGVIREEQSEATTSLSQRYYNSMVVIDSDGIITGAADKTHLVPFGEYLPFKEQLEALGLRAIAAADRGYVPAAQRRSLALPGGITALPLICYEVIFANQVERTAQTDQLMINVTNDAWYGNTPGPYQHLHQSQLRAVEMGLPMIRAANSGVSAVIDAKGRIKERLAFNEIGAIDAPLPGSIGQTFGKQFGTEIYWLLILFFTTIGLISRARQ